MKSRYNKCTSILGVLLLTGLIEIVGCTHDPEPTVDELFSFDLSAGDQLIYQGPYHGLTIIGPDTVNWDWADGELFIGNKMATVRVRPLEPFPHEEMTEEMILRARAYFVSVPFIDEWLEGNPDPSNEEWAVAYEAWLEAKSEFVTSLKIQYRDDDREDRTLVASELVEQANNHELVVAGSATFGCLDWGEDRCLWIAFRGVPPHEDGSLEQQFIGLERYWQEPAPLPTSISRNEAKKIHDAVKLLFDSSVGPLLIDMSTGFIVYTLDEKRL